jgi:hypothetical protein
MEYKASTAYIARHIPTGEKWYLLGIDSDRNKVCAAGWPATIANLSDMADFEERSALSTEEITYRDKTFGSNWI